MLRWLTLLIIDDQAINPYMQYPNDLSSATRWQSWFEISFNRSENLGKMNFDCMFWDILIFLWLTWLLIVCFASDLTMIFCSSKVSNLQPRRAYFIIMAWLNLHINCSCTSIWRFEASVSTLLETVPLWLKQVSWKTSSIKVLYLVPIVMVCTQTIG